MQAILQKEGISMSFAQTLKKRFSFGGADGGRSPKAAKGSANAAGGSGKKTSENTYAGGREAHE